MSNRVVTVLAIVFFMLAAQLGLSAWVTNPGTAIVAAEAELQQQRTPTATPEAEEEEAEATPAAPGDIIRAPAIAPPVATPGGDLPTDISIELVQVAGGLLQPVNVVSPPDDTGRLFVVERPGRVVIVENGEVLEEPFLDITDMTLSAFLEQGLYDIAFHPDFANNGLFYIHFAELLRNGDSMIVEYQVSEDNPNQANPDSARAILQIDQPWANHNGGELEFGPDGYLYIGSGDGGWEGDPLEAGQDESTLLGKILRIDVNIDQDERFRPYAIPADNPFTRNLELVQLFGITELEFAQIHTEARPEIWAWGLRNPWKFSFDSETGDLWLPDVGQNQWEEINFRPAGNQGGENYGWDFLMGSHCFPIQEESCPPIGVLPVAEYSHDNGDCAVIDIGVARNEEFADLDGIYFAGDFCSGRIWGIAQNPDPAEDEAQWIMEEVLDTELSITGSGEDQNGSLYVTSAPIGYGQQIDFDNPQGTLWQIVPSDQVPADAETAPTEAAAAGATPTPEEEAEATPTPEEEEAEATPTPEEEGAEMTPTPEEEEAEATPTPEEEAAAEETPVAEAEEEAPLVEVDAQPVTDQTVQVREVVVEEPSFVVVRAVSEQGQLGEVLGFTRVEAGETYNISIELDQEVPAGQNIAVVLHEDVGQMDEFEFPDGDQAIRQNGQIVGQRIQVTEAEGAEEMEATPTPAEEEAETTATPAEGAQAEQQPPVQVVAENIEFVIPEDNEVTVAAGSQVVMEFTNRDSVPHNWAAYMTSDAQEAIFVGEIITGPGETITYEFEAPSEPGNYYYQCDVHPQTMTGDFIVEESGG